MSIQEMVDKYLELIRNNKDHDDDMVNKIFKKHKMKVTIHLVISLGNYLDYLFGLKWDDDHYFMDKMKERYGGVI